MAELCELGLLETPHTSAGRVPSSSGLRFFVDQLLAPADHLVSTIATNATELLDSTHDLGPEAVGKLGIHAEAILLIVCKRLSGHGGKAGRILMRGLKDYC